MSSPEARRGRLLAVARSASFACVLCVAGVIGLAAPALAAGIQLTVSSGPEGGTYDRVGRALAQVLNEHGQIIEASVLSSPGSVGNVRRLRSGQADFALVQSDIARAAIAGIGPFPEPITEIKALAALYEETVHLVARKGSKITSIRSLAGRRVSLGKVGSGTRATVERLLLAAGVKPTAVTAVSVAPASAPAALARGDVEAFFVVSAAPNRVVQDALQGGNAELIAIPPEDLTAGEASDLEDAGIAESSLFQEDYPQLAEAIPTLAVQAVLCCRNGVPADIVYETLALAFAHRKALAAACGLLEEWAPEDAQEVALALHGGAVRFYYERNVIERPVKVFTGIYIRDIFDLDLKAQSFRIEATLWMRWRGRLEDDERDIAFRFVEGEIEAKRVVSVEHFGGWSYASYDVVVLLRGTFLLHKYPFDTQSLRIRVQHERFDRSDLVFVADTGGGAQNTVRSTLAKETVLDWEVSEVRHAAPEVDYPTGFGSPLDRGQRSWSRYEVTVVLKRLLVPYLLKFSLPLVLIGLMAYSSFLIHPEAYETKILVVIWVLFTAVEFHVYQSDSLPEIGYLVTADKFFLWTYAAVFGSLAHTLLSDMYFHRKDMKSVHRLRLIALVAFPAFFFGPIMYLMWVNL